MKWFMQGLRNYAVFDGRSGRREFWFYSLFAWLIWAALYVVDINIGTYSLWNGFKIGILSSIFTALVLVPNTSVSVRRLHDVSRSGWWLLLFPVPIVGGIVLTAFWSAESSPGDNNYGPGPAVQSA